MWETPAVSASSKERCEEWERLHRFPGFAPSGIPTALSHGLQKQKAYFGARFLAHHGLVGQKQFENGTA